MYIARVQIDGVGSFHDRRAADLDFVRPDRSYRGWTVIAGRNGSGKSTLLRAIALCLLRERDAFRLTGGLEDWLTEGRSTGSVTTTVLSDEVWDVGFGESREIPLEVSWKRVDLSSALVPEDSLVDSLPVQLPGTQPPVDEQEVVLEFPGPGTSISGLTAQPHTFPGWFFAGYGPFRRLGDEAMPGLVRRAQVGASRSAAMAVRTLFQERASLAEGVDWLVQMRLEQFEGRPGAEDLIETSKALLNDGLLPDQLVVEDVDSRGLWIRNLTTDRRAPLQQMSDGYRTVVALVLDILRRLHSAYSNLEFELVYDHDTPTLRYPGVVLIDEVDNHLHVAWQKAIGPWLTAHFPNVQFIVSTHSPFICQTADPNGLIRLPAPNEHASPRVIEPELHRRIVSGSADDAVLTELFGLESPYSAASEELRDELVLLEGRLVRGQASAQDRDRLHTLKLRLASSPATRVEEMSRVLRRHSESR